MDKTVSEMLDDVEKVMGKEFRDQLEAKIDDQRWSYGHDKYAEGCTYGYSDGYSAGQADVSND